MAGEKVAVISRVRIEKFNENMELEEVHESKTPEKNPDGSLYAVPTTNEPQ